MAGSSRTYLCVFAATLLLGLGAVAALNLLVDPNGAYPWMSLRALAAYRQQLVTRPAKAEMLLRQRCDVLLLGSSRVQVGIPVRHAAYGTDQVSNAGLNGTTLPEIATVLDFALRHQRPRRVLLGTDFFMFSDVKSETVGFENSRFDPDLSMFDYHLKNMLGSHTADDSWRLLGQWVRKERPLAVERGFLPKSLRSGASQRETFARCIRRFVTQPHVYGAYHYSERRLNLVRQMIRHCRDAGVELVIFIPPIHALELETIRAAGFWPTFERWKTDLVTLIAEEKATDSVPLWDFTGFSGPVIEDVPPPEDTHTRMRWYFENSHFTPALGELVLARMLSPQSGSSGAPGFGVRLTAANIEEALRRVRSDREAYARARSSEIEWVGQLTREKAVRNAGPETEL